jgi:hypothetical protein
VQLFQPLWSLFEGLSDDDLLSLQDQRDVHSGLSWPELLIGYQFVFPNAFPNSCCFLLLIQRETLQDASDRDGLAICLHSDHKSITSEESLE